MKLQYGLKHQVDAIKSISGVFKNVEIVSVDNNRVTNPVFEWEKNPAVFDTLKKNISNIQEKNNIPLNMRRCTCFSNEEPYLNIDVKMETGTGKTFLQIQTIFELNVNYGFSKFIIVVPTLTIKSGTKNFILSQDTKDFFKKWYNGAEIELRLLESIPKKKGRTYFPNVIREFILASSINSKKIQVMLVNSQLVTNSNLLTKKYDTTILDEIATPCEAIKKIKPILIVDEPHKFAKDNKSFNTIVERFSPQCIIRYGATFPEHEKKVKTEVDGKKTVIRDRIKDYNNLIYNLDSIDAFNQNLVKGVRAEYIPAGSTSYNVKIRLIGVENKTKCTIKKITDSVETKYDLERGESLSIIDQKFGNIEVEEIKKTSILLSNGTELLLRQELTPESFSESYQEKMIELALQRHFETEKENFGKGIKTLALFFIDEISSYRDVPGYTPYIREAFDRIFKEKLLNELNIATGEYREYLEASLNNVEDCRAGYFSMDNNNNDEKIINEINDILNDKEKILKIRNEDGKFNLRRFIFSKWTLKEGWDNPNVFTIAKLRSSGSEISKLQEVGRGLRLPVDWNLNRLDSEQYYLNYIVDFTEKDFIHELVNEINEGNISITKIPDEMWPDIAKELGSTEAEALLTLAGEKIIHLITHEILDESGFMEMCPATYAKWWRRLKDNKVVKRGEKTTTNVREDNFKRIESLWRQLNQRYLINYDPIDDSEIERTILDALNLFVGNADVVTSVSRQFDVVDGNTEIVESGGVSLTVNRTIKYNDFLIKLSNITHIPVINIHHAFVEYSTVSEIRGEFFNTTLLNNLGVEINRKMAELLFERFTYKKVDIPFYDTTFRDGDKIKKAIVMGNVGTMHIDGDAPSKYLYDTVAFDSTIEKKDILAEVNEVIVYGKIPKRTIRIPVANGSTYTPDFMYLVEKDDSSHELNLVIESKDYETENMLSNEENYRIHCAEKFFKQMQSDGVNIKYVRQLNNKQIGAIIKDLLS